MTDELSAELTPKKPWFKKKRFVIPLVFLVLSFIGGLSGGEDVSTETSSEEVSSEEVEREYPLEIESYAVVNPATISFQFRVTNDGTEEVTPTCYIKVQDPSGTYKGYDYFTPNDPLQPGVSKPLVGQLTITKEGAAFATEWSGKCTAKTRDMGSSKGKEVELYEIVNCSDYDSVEKEWFWGSCFKAKVAPMTQMNCSVDALDTKGNVVASQEYRATTGNNGAVMPYGDYVFPATTKAVVNSIKDFKISCSL